MKAVSIKEHCGKLRMTRYTKMADGNAKNSLLWKLGRIGYVSAYALYVINYIALHCFL